MTSFAVLLAQRTLTGGGMWGRGRVLSWSEIYALAQRLADKFGHLSGQRVMVSGTTAADYSIALCATAFLGCETWLQRSDVPARPGMAVLRIDGRNSELLDGVGEATGTVLPGSIVVYTSGTMGLARPRLWAFEDLWKLVGPASQTTRVWLSAYPVPSFAGLYTLLSAAVVAESLLLIGPDIGLPKQSNDDRCLICGTPTFWRRILLLSESHTIANLRPTIVSLGGEIASQDLLDKLRKTFQSARVVHVYASTELGSLFSISDGQCGFPTTLLNRVLRSGAILSVEHGELVARVGGTASPVMTGDAVRILGDRVLFDGRVDDVINVAGHKVRSQRVKEVISSLSFVIDVRVFPYPNAVTGNVVAAEVVVENRDNADVARARIRAHCSNNLDRAAQPRRITVVDRLPITVAGKANHGFRA